MTAKGARHAALKAGEVFYTTGKPCKNGHIARRHAKCGRCTECWQPSRAKSAQYTRDYYARHPGRADEIRFRYRYGVELADLRPKPSRCELCGKEHTKIVFDHCHATGKFRGWLCDPCNIVLGNVQDDAALLAKMIKYLQQHEVAGSVVEKGPVRQPKRAA